MGLPIISDNELLTVTKPGQYLGRERGSVVKDEDKIDLRVCLAFPDTYEVGMSHIGMQILYDLLNRQETIWAERAYVPLQDMERLLRSRGLRLTSLESKRQLSEFDIIGFSLQYELCATGILSILDLGGIPLLTAERNDNHPLIIGGGPVCYHPEPFSDFFDAFLIGDGEELALQFMNEVRKLKASKLSRRVILEHLSTIEGVYVPSFFEPEYDQCGNFITLKPLKSGYTKIRRRIISSLVGAPYPESPIVPNIKAVHDRLSVEVMRGCVRGCRFCQAGYLYRPQRERSPEDILKIVDKSLKHTGFEELSLLSLSTADYCSILPLLSSIKERFAQNDQLAISFPSTRVDALKPELLREVQPIRRSNFTVAPEAGTQRLRDVINKGVTDDEIINTCRNVFRLGWHTIKLYFMIGLPTETEEDIDGIIDLGRRIKEIAGPRHQVTVSVSTLVPKPHTPFQWARQISEGETVKIQQHLSRNLKRHKVNFRYHPAFSTFLEGVFARGDRKLSKVFMAAYEIGCRLEAWNESLSYEMWLEAFEVAGIDPHPYLHARDQEYCLPWDHISCDIPKEYFLKEWQRALSFRTTPDCLTKTCSICGACDYDSVRNELFDRLRTEKRLGIIDPPWNKPHPEDNFREFNSESQKNTNTPITPNDLEPEGTYQLREYLRTEVDLSRPRAEKTALPIVQRIRLHYMKLGPAKFFSHLELKSIFFRAARRANVPLAFSRGFSPQPKIIFGPPLQLGAESEHEYLDFFLTQTISTDSIERSIVDSLTRELPNGLKIVKGWEVLLKAPPIQVAITSQTYKADIVDAWQDEYRLLNREHILEDWKSKKVTRARKGQVSSVKLGEIIEQINLYNLSLSFKLKVLTNGASLRPSEVTEALTKLPIESFNIRKIDVAFN